MLKAMLGLVRTMFLASVTFLADSFIFLAVMYKRERLLRKLPK